MSVFVYVLISYVSNNHIVGNTHPVLLASIDQEPIKSLINNVMFIDPISLFFWSFFVCLGVFFWGGVSYVRKHFTRYKLANKVNARI